MKWIIDNWSLLVAIIGFAVCGYFYVYRFSKLPSSEQLEKIKNWLLFAVIQAEKELGNGTGALKLRYVYNLFLNTFPALVDVISFDMFSKLVDEVLEQMRHLLDTNLDIKNYVEGDVE